MRSTSAREFLRSHVLGLVAIFIALTGTAVASQQSGTSGGPKASASVVTDAKFKKLKQRVAAIEQKIAAPRRTARSSRPRFHQADRRAACSTRDLSEPVGAGG